MNESELTPLLRRIVDTEIFGRVSDSYDLDRVAFLAAAVTSATYAQRRMRKANRLPNALALLDFALQMSPPVGLALEFGVASGRTINFIAERVNRQVHGFDAFTGLPED